MKIIVTGGAGFIGSALVNHLLHAGDHSIVNVDKLAYAGSRHTVEQWRGEPRHVFEQRDICNAPAMARLFQEYRPDAVMHLAAETHVDRSIDGPGDFIRSNVLGTYTLIEAALNYWRGLAGPARENFRFHHISTDEVFGSLDQHGAAFTETTPYAPRSPYAASKAASDHLALAWHHTYALPVLLSNCSNNYGARQFPEKLIPLTILKATAGQPIPVYGTGTNVRDWLFVEDHVAALAAILDRGRPGETYNVGGNAERTNLQVVRAICTLLDELRPGDPVVPHEKLITFVEDRPGHDLRYAMDTRKIRADLGWQPGVDFEAGLRQTVVWYLENTDWVAAVSDGVYDGTRLGLAR